MSETLQQRTPENGEYTGNDSLRRYIHEASSYPLLDAEEEMDLAKRIAAGKAAKEMVGETVQLPDNLKGIIITDSERAREKMMVSNLRLVMSMAFKVAHRYDGDVLGAIQEGNLGLDHAIGKFDHARGYKFSTYARQWIFQALQRGERHNRQTVSIPHHVTLEDSRFKKAEEELTMWYGHRPEDKEIAEEANVSLEKIHALRLAKEPEWLDGPRRASEKSDSRTLGDAVPDTAEIDVEEQVIEQETLRHMQGQVDRAFETLTESEKFVLRSLYGFDGAEPLSIKKLARTSDMTQHRVTKLRKQAEQKVREYIEGGDDERANETYPKAS